ncbi:hypothetical protein CDD80_5546 [Ophiocordyceps camponoti-rufipedis]|uniref:Uncharacterized protein n=1 Tax=Ophiocordyceps camponoti-rufipedis TaxID=2004952 RepID=A0A2C5YVX7_9HYPO|nr:hypothetical protein CDD80_5546 [Ophiocordyceps camponoti-rufipedis]
MDSPNGIPKPPSPIHGLQGTTIDHLGNVVSPQGSILGRASGDLPAMLGRPVDQDGRILDKDGQVVGYVQEAFRRQLASGLSVDDQGTIFDGHGRPVGCLHVEPKAEEEEESTKTTTHDDSKARPQHNPPSPSDICLDIKSTHDGIQLVIKIPTVFPKSN